MSEPPCECAGPGFCPRYQIEQDQYAHGVCSAKGMPGFPPNPYLSEVYRAEWRKRLDRRIGLRVTPPTDPGPAQAPVPRSTGRFSLKCIHRGERTGEIRPCKVCGGSRDVPLYACPIHGTCTTDMPIPEIQWCRTCTTKVAESPDLHETPADITAN